MKHKKYITSLITVGVLTLVFFACKKDTSNELSLKRSFAPNTITTTNGETSATVAWPISLFTTTGQATYAIEVSKDLTFVEIAFTTTTTDLSVVISDDKLTIKKDYYARVKTIGLNGATDSNWTISPVFRITGEQFLNPVKNTNLTDVAVQLTWRLNPDLTKITITTAGGTPPPFDVVLGAPELAAGVVVVPGLTQKTNYTAEIFAATKSKGTVSFKTLASITGNIVDISGGPVTGNIDIGPTITGAPAGSVILLRRGQQYTNGIAGAGNTNYTKSVTFQSQLGFGTNYAILRFGAIVGPTASVDSIVFRDVIIKGGRTGNTSFDSDYAFSMGTAATVVGKLRFDNCIIKIFRGIGRMNASGTRITNYIVNNCVIDSVKDFSIAHVQNVAGGAGFGNITITNTTIYKARKLITVAAGGTAFTSVLIDACTFNEAPSNNGTNYFIDLNNASVTNGIAIKNTIFGGIWADAAPGTAPFGYRAAVGSGINVVNSYSTSDFSFAPATNAPLPGPIPYSGTSTALFTAPSTGNFLIKDATFIGKSTSGDPRWRIN